ncbi:alpha/beta fold hydrolase [Amycolatopsis anabasis]|uniref:alpha/beta fold hydrolase n=1 Tax=Amycolatopsis anabasis TaxID=1840409 RepID=UPI00131D792F|nr:alpha/beta hydrolase [Amycolatopsis anabasis]
MTPAAPPAVLAWRDGGSPVRTGAGPIFVRTTGGAGRRIVFLHGYPSSGYDFRHVVEHFPGTPTLVLDFLGFGLSAKPRRHRYSLFEQADLVEEVVALHETGPVAVVAHDMGTSVATELMARDLRGELGFELEHVVLSNGSVLLDRATLRPIQQVLRGPLGPVAARLSNRPMFVREFSRLFSPDHPLGREEAAAQWALIANEGGNRIMHLLAGYLGERVTHAPRWHGAVRDWPKPLGLLWGLRDPVATVDVLAGLRELRPSAGVVELPELGHYPQIEDPGTYADGVRTLLGSAQDGA